MGASKIPSEFVYQNGMDYADKSNQISRTPGRKRRKDHRLLGVVSSRKRRFIPWASLVALLVTWIGLFLFATKLYDGMLDLEEQSQGLFKFLLPYLKMVRQATVISAIVMAALTAMMAIVGFFATLHTDHCYRGRTSSCTCSKLGSRVMCALFWILSYLLNLCWMGILSFMVVMTSAYFAFLPVCLPQSGTVDSYCLNFTVLSSLMTGASDANAVNLLLCGGAIDKLCKLTKAILPWYWGAYLGCVAVLLGLSHFNGSLAANFAHGKHAIRYVKIRDRTSPTIQWTKDWRVKSLVYFDASTDTTVSLRKRSIKPIVNGGSIYPADHEKGRKAVANGHIPNGNGVLPASKRRDSTTCSETETESDVDLEQSSPSRDFKTSTGSIVLSLQRQGDPKKVLALPAPPVKMNGDARSPPTPPYKPARPASLQSNGTDSHNYRPPVPPYKPRPSSALTQHSTSSTSFPMNGGLKEVRV